MTAITRPVVRETSTTYRRRALCVTLSPSFVYIREKGRRDSVPVPYDAIYELGLKLRARQARAEQIAEKSGRKVSQK